MIREHYTKSLEASLERIPYGYDEVELESGIRSPTVSQMSEVVRWDHQHAHTDIRMTSNTPGMRRSIYIGFSRKDCQDVLDKVSFTQRDITFKPWKPGSEKIQTPVCHEGSVQEISLRGLRKIARATRRAANAIDRVQAIASSGYLSETPVGS